MHFGGPLRCGIPTMVNNVVLAIASARP